MKRLSIIAAVLFASAPAAAEPRRITLDEAVELATQGNIEVTVGREQISVEEAKVRGTRALRLPTLGVKASVLYWDDEFAIAVAPGAPEVVGREQITSSIDVTVVQPITAAAVLGKLIELEENMVTATRADLDSKRLEVAYKTADMYLQTLQMATLREIAQTSVTQLEANLQRAQALKAAGILFDVDLLRLEAQRDSLRQQVLEAEVGAEMMRRALALQLGLPDGTDLELAPVDTTPPELPWTEDEAVAAARQGRPEARAAEARADAADLGILVQKAQYLPGLAVVANYNHSEGNGAFALKDSAFVGLQLEWNIWDWGKRRGDVDQAKAQARQAKLLRDETDDIVALDVRSKWLQASTRRKTLDVAESGLRAAEEAHRLQNVRFQEGAATTTDVIDAESEVARARAQATIARYQYLTAWMALVRAVGQVPKIPATRSP